MNKKKIIIGIVGGLLAVLIIAVLIVATKLDAIVETGIKTVGPKLTKTTIQLEKVSIRPLSGSGAVSGLVVGSPDGYKAEYTMKMDHAHLSIKPMSLLSDKVVVDTIIVDGPEIILEGGLKENNLTAIQKNVTDTVGAGGATAPTTPAASEPAGASKKLQLNHLKLTGIKVHLRLSMLAGKNITIAAPDFEIKDLGTGPEGITVGEIVKRALNELTAEVLAAAAKSVADAGKDAANAAVGTATKESTEAVGKAAEGLKSLFKKKE